MQTDFHASTEICPQKCMSELFDNKESRTLWKRRLDKQRLRDSTPSKQLDDSHTVLNRMPKVQDAQLPFLRRTPLSFSFLCACHIRKITLEIRNLYLCNNAIIASRSPYVNIFIFLYNSLPFRSWTPHLPEPSLPQGSGDPGEDHACFTS